MKSNFKYLLLITVIFIIFIIANSRVNSFFSANLNTELLLARAGGGGSSSGGSGGSSGGSSSNSRSGGGSDDLSSGQLMQMILAVFLIIVVQCIYIFVFPRRPEKIKYNKIKDTIKKFSINDPIWTEDVLRKRVEEVFYQFQKDWSDLNPASMRNYLMPGFYKNMVLKMSVMENQHRKNLMDSLKIEYIEFLNAEDKEDNSLDSFTVGIGASANDILVDTKTNEEYYDDDSSFVEFWTFGREGDVWKLKEIRQDTEESSLLENSISEFAKKNNFSYDSDFGWLLIPNKGVVFSRSNFRSSDINNYVVGYFRDKIVQFYTFIPKPGGLKSPNYLVAQTDLPINYNNILVQRKKGLLANLFSSGPSGLRKIETESNDFNAKFNLWAAEGDEARSFELLTPNFMEKIYNLPFELNIEVVGNFLYFYTESRKDIDYYKMMEIMSWAFDEMKM